jgi:hypothetical protein
MCNVLFSCACILLGQVFMCGYIFAVKYSFVRTFHEVTFYNVPLCIFDKSVCTAGEESLRNTGLKMLFSCSCNTIFCNFGGSKNAIVTQLPVILGCRGCEDVVGGYLNCNTLWSTKCLWPLTTQQGVTAQKTVTEKPRHIPPFCYTLVNGV